MMRIPVFDPTATPMFCTARRTAGQKIEMKRADLTPNFLMAQPVTKRFRTPKMVVEALRMDIAIEVDASMAWTD